ncbi:hypothetical protein IU436_02610 [Nocardia farcinica]|uniref:hypothetical protein n=1 Tax=Nocardia farcinica TaxID=37329 RepID=UPI0018948E11|nr:hypothetical protein [Nocardia farcinica]MBF6417251.1 hypothetical protein [Nocardia farcinica]MBF6429243.1 hypothetical protein [Nocardia farcinica]MBF6505693.1 hypothetical protein [Nocardia farcinica]
MSSLMPTRAASKGGQFGLGEVVGLSAGLGGVAGVGFELLAQLVPVGVAGPQPHIDLVSGADGAAGLAHGLLILHGHDRDLGADLGRGDPLLGEGLEQLRHPPAHFLAGSTITGVWSRSTWRTTRHK